MSKETLDIVKLINDKSSTLDNIYQDKVIQKIKENFTTDEEHLFVASFECYLKYDSKLDFPLILDRIWKWLGYGRIEECKRCLIKNFKLDIDYKIENFAPQDGGAKTEPTEEQEKQEYRGGHNREYITLTINCFKKLCLKSKTDKADVIHDYYVKLENIIHQVMKEEMLAMKNELKLKDKEIEDVALKNEQNLLLKHNKKRCFYLILVNDKIIKFGITNDIITRLANHKREISEDIVLIYILETVYNAIIEKKIKELCNNENDILYEKRITLKFNGKVQTELINLDKLFTIEQLWNKVLKIEKSINKDEIFSEMENRIDILENQLKFKKEDSREYNEYNYIYLEPNETVNQYTIDLTNDFDKFKNIYKTENSKHIKNLVYVLLEAVQVNENIFEMPYNSIKAVLEYCIMTYDFYRIHINDTFRFNNLYNYVTRYPEDKLIIKNSKEIITKNIYQTYISDKIEFGECYKVAVISIYDDFSNWYINKFPKSKLDLSKISDKELKEDIVKNFCEITKIEKTVVNTYDKNRDKKMSSYPGFVGFRIKEEITVLYKQEIYEEFFNSKVINTGNLTDKVFRRPIIDLFVDFIRKKYEIHKDTVGKERYKLIFINEFTKMFKIIVNVEYDEELRSSAAKTNLHGGFRCCKML